MSLRFRIAAPFDEGSKRRNYYFVYTVLFIILAFSCFSFVFLSGRTLIHHGDGWYQHFKAYVYYSEYLKEILHHLFTDHKLIIPSWDFNIGEGGDILNTLHYYVIGDPITALCVFVPTKYMQYFYSAACILRLYLAGIAFSELCFGTGKKNRYAIMAGSFAYACSLFGLYFSARHPFFVNPMIWFPLLILGTEKIIRKERPYLFIVFVAVSGISNFYFFYMIAVLTAAYALIRLIMLYKSKVKEALVALLKLAVTAMIGACIAGAILLPVFMIFLQDARLSTQAQQFRLFYPLIYYSQLPAAAVSVKNSYDLFIGLSAPVWLAVALLFFQKKKETFLKVLFIICILIILFPICGRALNGMSYATNRWIWAFDLLCCYILVTQWDGLIAVTKKHWNMLAVFTAVYYLVLFIVKKSGSAGAFSAVFLFAVILMVLKMTDEDRKTKRQLLLLAVAMIGVFNVAFWEYAPAGADFASLMEENSKIWSLRWPDNETKIVKEAAQDSFSRYSGRTIEHNVNMVNGISNTAYYFSNSNPNVSRFREEMQMREEVSFQYRSYDERTALNTLSAVQYYVVGEDQQRGLPYGYEKVLTMNALSEQWEQYVDKLQDELGVDRLSAAQRRKLTSDLKNVYTVYENQFALPLGYCYSSIIDEETWDRLDPVQKQQIQLSAALIDRKADGMKEYEGTEPDYTIPYEIVCKGDDVSLQGNCFIVTSDNAKAVLKLEDSLKKSETCFGIEGLDFQPVPEYDLYFGNPELDPLDLYNLTDLELKSAKELRKMKQEKVYWDPTAANLHLNIRSSAGVSKEIVYRQPEARFSSGRRDYIVNLGYTKNRVKSITLTFPLRGVYSFDSLRVYNVPMKGYEKKVRALRKDVLEDCKLGVDQMTGKIRAGGNRILCVAIPYSGGWRVWVDG